MEDLRGVYLVNLLVATLAGAATVAGLGLLWPKAWARWLAVVTVAVSLVYHVAAWIPVWMQMLGGTYRNPGIRLWTDYITMGLYIGIIAVLTLLWPQMTSRGSQPTDGEGFGSAGAAPSPSS